MLALIAGQGQLPTRLAEAVPPARVFALEGFPPDALTPDTTFRIETLGSLIAEMTEAGVTRVVMAGSIARPPLDPSAIDAATLPFVPRMMQALQAGDDAALRVVLSFFEEAGIQVVGAHQLLPDLLPAMGVLTERAPDEQAAKDCARGAEVLRILGAADVGQGVVVKGGQVLAVEGMFGTDWMLESLTQRPDGRGGVFVKAPKPGQDRRVDMPTIGPMTVRRAADAGLDGIVIAAGGVFVLDVATTVAAANAAGVYLDVASLTSD